MNRTTKTPYALAAAALLLCAAARCAQAHEQYEPYYGTDPAPRLLDAVRRAREGHVDEALDAFEALRREHPDRPEPYNNLAVLYAVRGRLEEAREVLLDAIERHPDLVAAHANLAEVYTKLARRARARAEALGYHGGVDPDPPVASLVRAPVAAPTEQDTRVQVPDTVPPIEHRTRTRPPDAVPIERDHAQPPDEAPIEWDRPDAPPTERDVAGRTRTPPVEHLPLDYRSPEELLSAAPIEWDAPNRDPEQPPDTRHVVADVPIIASVPNTAVQCVRAGGFTSRKDARRADQWLHEHGLEAHEPQLAKYKIVNHRVYLPSFATREEAEAKVREAQARGISDVAVVRRGPLKNAVSFGVYPDEDDARRRVDGLERIGYPIRRTRLSRTGWRYEVQARTDAPFTDRHHASWASLFPRNPIEVGRCDD